MTMPSRKPRQLLLALFGEHVVDRYDRPLSAGVLIEILGSAGVGAAAARATLDRMVARGLLVRERRGREIAFALTDDARGVLREASTRVHADRPFEADGPGWTLVTFTLPESRRELRHRLRAILTWHGFAPLRDGLWLAPGEVDLVASLAPLRDHLPEDVILGFRARELMGFPLGVAVRSAWDLATLRAAHEEFLREWEHAPAEAASPLAAQTMLVADWLALLRADPRLPADFLGDDWPAARSLELYRARRRELSPPASAAFAALTGMAETVAAV